MVTVTVYMEGGADASLPGDVLTADNTQALRESLYRLLSENIADEVSIRVDMKHGVKNVVKQFLNHSADPSLFLFVDLDGGPGTQSAWFEKLENEGYRWSEAEKPRCFFMIQAMEAWILYQPEVLDEWGKQNGLIRRKPDTKIADDNNLTGKAVPGIRHPDHVLSTLLGRYFKEPDKEKKRSKTKYGKLKTAPALLDLLDARLLGKQDPELARFIAMFKK